MVDIHYVTLKDMAQPVKLGMATGTKGGFNQRLDEP